MIVSSWNAFALPCDAEGEICKVSNVEWEGVGLCGAASTEADTKCYRCALNCS